MPCYDVNVIHYHTVSVCASDVDEAADLALDMEEHGECWEMMIGDITKTDTCTDNSTYNYTAYLNNVSNSGYTAYSGFSQLLPATTRTTLANGYTTYC
jgi:hypothetical protein